MNGEGSIATRLRNYLTEYLSLRQAFVATGRVRSSSLFANTNFKHNRFFQKDGQSRSFWFLFASKYLHVTYSYRLRVYSVTLLCVCDIESSGCVAVKIVLFLNKNGCILTFFGKHLIDTRFLYLLIIINIILTITTILSRV